MENFPYLTVLHDEDVEIETVCF